MASLYNEKNLKDAKDQFRMAVDRGEINCDRIANPRPRANYVLSRLHTDDFAETSLHTQCDSCNNLAGLSVQLRESVGGTLRGLLSDQKALEGLWE